MQFCCIQAKMAVNYVLKILHQLADADMNIQLNLMFNYDKCTTSALKVMYASMNFEQKNQTLPSKISLQTDE